MDKKLTPFYWVCKVGAIEESTLYFEIIASFNGSAIGTHWTETEDSLKNIRKTYRYLFCSSLEEVKEIMFLDRI